jgi:hypothetical protein
MYPAIVRRRTARVFDRLSHGEWHAPAADLAPDVHHVFPGDHPLGASPPPAKRCSRRGSRRLEPRR